MLINLNYVALRKHTEMDIKKVTDKKSIDIFAGGTRFYIAPHLALSAPAEGNTGFLLETICQKVFGDKMDIRLHLTRQAKPHRILANDPP